jgi:alpha-1,3-rhamnosyl/mannosyltransferase
MTVVLDARVATDHFPGIGRVAIRLAEALVRVRPESDLAVLHDPASISKRLGRPAGRLIPCRARPFSLASQWSIPALLRRSGAGVYHNLFYGMPYHAGVPTIWSCYDLTPLAQPALFDPVRRAAFRLAHRLAIGSSRRITVSSEVTANDLERFFQVPRERIALIPWGVDARFAPQSDETLRSLRTRLELPERYVLFLGINKPHKNLVRLIEAFAQVRDRSPEGDLTLVVAGVWDPRYPEARELARRLDLGRSVRFLGPVPEADLPALYAAALAFAFPSEYEGFGLPLLEAMASGTPSLTSTTSSLPEVAGDAALLVPPTDVAAIADALLRLVTDSSLRADLARRGRTRALQFTWERTAEQMWGEYDRLASGVRT